MQRVQNLGSLLQSYALKRMLESQGCDVSFLDIEKREEDNALLHGKTDHFASEMESSCPFLGKLKKIDRYAINRIRIRKLADCQDRYFDQFRDSVLNIRPGDNKGHYDLCVIGSDEVFNCLTPSAWGFTTQLFGNVSQADAVITYAASCGSTKITDLNSETKQAIRSSFRKISAFSARDDATKAFTEQLASGQSVLKHSDPVWCYDFSHEIHNLPLPQSLPQRYCVIYSYYNRIHDPAEIDAITTFCKQHDLTPVAVGAPQMWLKAYVVGSVFQLLKVFENADFIITDTFHGTILSQKFNGRFAVTLRGSNKNKLSDLIRTIHAEEHFVSSFSELSSVYGAVSPKNRSQQYQKEAYTEAIAYLKENISYGDQNGNGKSNEISD